MKYKYLTKKERKFFDVAKAVARTSDFDRTHVGCAVIMNKCVLSVASNSNKSHTIQHTYNRFRNFKDTTNVVDKVHAEVHALSWLIDKPINWHNVDIYVYREWKDGTPAISKPCPACSKLINDLGIKNLYYIDENKNYVKEKLK